MTIDLLKLIRFMAMIAAFIPAYAVSASDELLRGISPPDDAVGLVYLERIVVTPDDAGETRQPVESRWVRFERALGPGRSCASRHHVEAVRNNDGTRVECYSPCILGCCAGSGDFSLPGAGFGIR